MTTIEGNRIIAEFMGSCALEEAGKPNMGMVRNAAKYHSSWDWLMPVWFKFRDLVLNDNLVDTHKEYVGCIGQAIIYTDDKDCTNAFIELCEAIEWYNKQNKT